MITQAVLNFFAQIFSLVTAALPTGSSLGVNTVASDLEGSGVFSHVGWLNAYIPVEEATTVLLLLIGLFAVMTVIRIVLWVLKTVHVAG